MVPEQPAGRPQVPGDDPRGRFRTLPEPVRLDDTIESHDPLPPPDPTLGRDPDQDFLLRHAG